ncbi:MAG: hypothetical protein JXA92_05120 [candidate division Zixibacteria bacterium]|nr:hypothetical protein [candidate division Zixibacteria bacterium]
MTARHIGGILLLVLVLFLAFSGCEKEKIVESTEYIHDIEYLELPPETVRTFDTLVIHDSTVVNAIDTILVWDTIIQTNYVFDTIIQTNYIYDTVIQTNYVYDTVYQTNYIHDTVTVIQNHYDTVEVVDTVMLAQCTPNEYLAVAALQYYCDPLVFEFIYDEFGIEDGWVYYLSTFQIALMKQSDGIYDIYGYIDYWMADWSGYYPLEYYWRLVHTGGDPADPSNWQLAEPPAAAGPFDPGLKLSDQTRESSPALR